MVKYNSDNKKYNINEDNISYKYSEYNNNYLNWKTRFLVMTCQLSGNPQLKAYVTQLKIQIDDVTDHVTSLLKKFMQFILIFG